MRHGRTTGTAGRANFPVGQTPWFGDIFEAPEIKWDKRSWQQLD
jgi:hypothetical protein